MQKIKLHHFPTCESQLLNNKFILKMNTSLINAHTYTFTHYGKYWELDHMFFYIKVMQ